MTSFVHPSFPASHPGVQRLEEAVAAAGRIRKSFDGAKGLAAMLLAAMVAALVVVADQLVVTWADGHLLAAWVVLWATGFAALALLSGTARQVARRVTVDLDAWSQRTARARADARLWDLAQKDSRVMADLRAAATRAESETVCRVIAQHDEQAHRAAPEASHLWYM